MFSVQEFDDPRDAEDAVSALDGHELHGERLIVEFSKGGGRSDRSRRRYYTHLFLVRIWLYLLAVPAITLCVCSAGASS